jgi:hypothetical protein
VHWEWVVHAKLEKSGEQISTHSDHIFPVCGFGVGTGGIVDTDRNIFIFFRADISLSHRRYVRIQHKGKEAMKREEKAGVKSRHGMHAIARISRKSSWQA